jgi:hypothetical protein
MNTEFKMHDAVEERVHEAAANFAQLRKWFGPPPVLSTENQKAYDDLTMHLLRTFRPNDFIELMYIRALADSTWEIVRYSRHKILAIDRKFRAHFELQAKRQRARAKLKEAKARELGQKDGETATQIDRMIEPEDTFDCSVEDVGSISQKAADEHDHARALEGSIDYYERVDKLLASATARRDSDLEQLKQHREDLGPRLWRDRHLDDHIELLHDFDLALIEELHEPSDGAAK